MTAKGDQLLAVKMQAANKLDKELEERIAVIFQLLDPFELDATYPAFEAAFLAEVERSGEKHFNLNKGFLKAYILEEFGKTASGLEAGYVAMSSTRREAVASSLSAVTRAGIKAHTANGDNIIKAYKDAGTRAVGVGRRNARQPAREFTASVSRKTRGLGYYKRVLTGRESCNWCAMIASRGAVYTIDTAEGAWHDNCDCEIAPASRDTGPTPTYDQKLIVKKNKSGLDKDKIKQNILEWERKRAEAGHKVVSAFPNDPS